MRLPNSKDMSAEQKKVYLKAPLDGAILVSGPPGTGKTVIAFMRAETFARKKQSVTVAMYNRVLQTYTKNASSNPDINVQTLHSWLWHWWRQLRVPSAPDSVARFDLDCPFREKDQAKAAGARWDGRRKKWWVSKEAFESKKDVFARWSPKPAPMEIPTVDDAWTHDWSSMSLGLLSAARNGDVVKDAIHWGHLIIDEAQDFPKEMFAFFSLLSGQVFQSDGKAAPSLTIFADENQRLNPDNNSTILEIRKALNMTDSREYKLSRNYRNTKPIAKLARTFYVGLQTGIPDMPEETGDIPILFEGRDISETIQYLARYARSHDNEQIGVIVQQNKMRKRVFNKLDHALRGSSSRVQTYASNDSHHGDASGLELDEGGWVTVINKQSCKGLEFDAVFLVELQEVAMDPGSVDQFKMDMYVMCSRARTSLGLMYTNEGDSTPQFLEHLPTENDGLVERI